MEKRREEGLEPCIAYVQKKKEGSFSAVSHSAVSLPAVNWHCHGSMILMVTSVRRSIVA
jgi:hypothetical protein